MMVTPLPAKTLKELIADRIDFLETIASSCFGFPESYCKGIQGGIKELEWVRRMMEDKKEEMC